jgi:succinate dehydrogenase/fumarate reductase-like Fe-S protein
MSDQSTTHPIVLHVRRVQGDSPVWERYELASEERTTVFMALRAVYESQDATLAFRNYTCWKGLCRACEVTVDGDSVKGCLAVLEPGHEYRIEPRPEHAAQRDLFVPGRRKAFECR